MGEALCLGLDPPQSESEEGVGEGSSEDDFPSSGEASGTCYGRNRFDVARSFIFNGVGFWSGQL